jgi:hypothetical protein
MHYTFRIPIFIFFTFFLVLLSRKYFITQDINELIPTKENNNMAYQIALREGIVGGFAGVTVK